MKHKSRRPRSEVGRSAAAGVLLVGLVLAAYVPVVRCGYVWDDDDYILNNNTLRSGEGLRRIWFELTAAPQECPQYYPLVHTSFWLEYQSWQTAPLGYHVDNVLLHALAAVLLWRVLAALAVPGAWLAAALFGLHPVHVESVAWITERKNVLAGVFYLAAALAYLRFALPSRESQPRAPRWWLYAVGLVLFLCALLSKTVTCTLPAVLLIVLWWQRGHILRRDVLLLIPLFALGLAFGLLTSWMERRYVGASGKDWNLDFLGRCLLAGRAPWFYPGKLLWPYPLVFIYPRWLIDSRAWVSYLYPLATLATVAGLWLARRRIGRGPLAAILCFGATLFPALGFFNVYPMRYSYVADHFQYLASACILALVVAVATCAARRTLGAQARRAWPIAVPAVLALGVLTWRQVPAYANLESLWRDTLRKNPTAWMAHNNLGLLLQKRGALDEALAHFQQAVALAPEEVEPHANLGDALMARGRVDEALTHYQRGVELDPRQPTLRYNLATVLAQRGRLDEAIRQYRQTLAHAPDAPQVLLNLGWALMKQGHLDEAVQCCQKALQVQPGSAQAHHQLGLALMRQGQAAAAAEQLREALRLDPNDAEARRALQAATSSQPSR